MIDQVLTMVNVMVALAVVIALIGIANTLALSVFERTRELGLVRAVGMTRRQLRRMVRYEAALVATFGATLGVGLGLLFGFGVVSALPASFASGVAIPISQIVIVMLVAARRGRGRRMAPCPPSRAASTCSTRSPAESSRPECTTALRPRPHSFHPLHPIQSLIISEGDISHEHALHELACHEHVILRDATMPSGGDHATRTSRVRRLVGVVARPHSYRNIGYLLLGLPLGTVWFTVMVSALSVAASLLVVALLGDPDAAGHVVRRPRLRQRRARRGQRAARSRSIPYAPMGSAHRGNPWVRLRSTDP